MTKYLVRNQTLYFNPASNDTDPDGSFANPFSNIDILKNLTNDMNIVLMDLLSLNLTLNFNKWNISFMLDKSIIFKAFFFLIYLNILFNYFYF